MPLFFFSVFSPRWLVFLIAADIQSVLNHIAQCTKVHILLNKIRIHLATAKPSQSKMKQKTEVIPHGFSTLHKLHFAISLSFSFSLPHKIAIKCTPQTKRMNDCNEDGFNCTSLNEAQNKRRNFLCS